MHVFPSAFRAPVAAAMLLGLSRPPVATGCVFDCWQNDYCGPEPTLINKTFHILSLDSMAHYVPMLSPPLTTLDLSRRNITSIANTGLDCFFRTMGGSSVVHRNIPDAIQAIVLDDNALTEFPSLLTFQQAGITSLRNNSISELRPGAFSNSYVGHAIIDLSLNQIENINMNQTIGEGVFSNFFGNDLQVNLSKNQITSIGPQTFSGFRSSLLAVDLWQNNVTSLGNAVFNGFSGATMMVDLSENGLQSAGGIFFGFQGTSECVVDMSHNLLNETSLKQIFESYTQSVARLALNLDSNLVRVVPTQIFERVGTDTTGFVDIVLNLMSNPLRAVMPIQGYDATLDENDFYFGDADEEDDYFDSDPSVVYARLGTVALNLSHPTTGPFVNQTANFTFNAVEWAAGGGTVILDLTDTGVVLEIVAALSEDPAGPAIMTLVLAENQYTSVPAGVFAGSRVDVLDLSRNNITYISPDAFSYNLLLHHLDLAGNRLTEISTSLLSNTPALSRLVLADNRIAALPATSNHIAFGSDVDGNVIQCEEYGPMAKGCHCPVNYSLSAVFCGYVRCYPAEYINGCPNESYFNRTDCSRAPLSSCVSYGTLPAHQFYSYAIDAFLPVTDCNTEFTCSGANCATGYRQSYEVEPRTLTSDRQCSICSSCPSGFDSTPCTATSNTQCTKQFALGKGAIAAMVIAVSIPLILLIAALYYIRFRTELKRTRNDLGVTRTELGETKNYLELTERLLGDEREQNELMEQAWSIKETDLKFGDVIGQGAFGVVFHGMWGHIAVAIKVLRQPVDDLDPLVLDDFNREVKVMRSIRHPHLLTFFGAGVDQNSRAFLVTELMKGSLQPMLHDSTQHLSWGVRLMFASDICSGMTYLHEKTMIHRDLKCDNCFVDNAFRVKVADFGTGRIAASMQETETRRESESSRGSRTSRGSQRGARKLSRTASKRGSDRSTKQQRDHSGDSGFSGLSTRTLSQGVGSLMWMSPEAVRGDRIEESLAPALDVYSYGVVLFEIWTRAFPWSEVQGEGLDFIKALSKVVVKGGRPRLPERLEAAPEGYGALMEKCWTQDPKARPSFVTIDQQLAQIKDRMMAVSESDM